MKKLLLVLFMGALFTTVNAQKVIGEITMQDGSKIETYDGSNNEKAEKLLRKKGNLAISNSVVSKMKVAGGVLYYFNQEGDLLTASADEIKQVLVKGGQVKMTLRSTSLSTDYGTIDSPDLVLLPLAIRGKQLRFMERIAENESYILVNMFSDGINFFHVFDKEGNIVEKSFSHSLTKKKSQKALEKVKEYFGDCSTLISGMEDNIQNKWGKGIRAQYLLLKTMNEDNLGSNVLTNIKCN